MPLNTLVLTTINEVYNRRKISLYLLPNIKKNPFSSVLLQNFSLLKILASSLVLKSNHIWKSISFHIEMSKISDLSDLLFALTILKYVKIQRLHLNTKRLWIQLKLKVKMMLFTFNRGKNFSLHPISLSHCVIALIYGNSLYLMNTQEVYTY